jgi:RNA polymerase sigma-70 factor (ECF subfamily)
MEECLRLLPELNLIEKARSGDERAFRFLLERHHSLIYSIVHGVLQNRADAEDVVQDVFIRIYRGLPEFRGASQLSTWIYRIARNEALNALARRRMRHVPLDECAELPSGNGAPDQRLSESETARLLERCMMRLDEQQRIAIDLFYRGEQTYEEIAEIMDIPIGTVKTHIHRGKIELRRLLARGAAGFSAKGSGDL